jgi:hypothetical protein
MAALLVAAVELALHAPWLLLVIFAAPFVLRAFL